MTKYELVFDKVIIRQLRKASKNRHASQILKNMLDKLEKKGPAAGQLLDFTSGLYELKNKRPPIRLYFKHEKTTDEIKVFEYEMKTSKNK